MKKLLSFLLLILLISPANALTLEGGVKKIETVQDAKQEVFLKPIWVIDPHPYEMYAKKAPEGYRIDDDNNGYSVASGKKMYDYENNKLVSIAISDKNVMNFPRKLLRYEYPSGKLTELTYGTSPTDGYVFRPDGSIKCIWEKGIRYEGERATMKTSTSYF